MKYEAVIDIVYPNGGVMTFTHPAPWIWLAAMICRFYIYGSMLMPFTRGGIVGMTLIRRRAAIDASGHESLPTHKEGGD